ncbi:MAG: LysM peptidoglycan-binding domain-containing protein [Clostridiales bacterium]|nr:LysM peptidoglycan-binding domain-containing protein [Candidatus Crickella caballi]
MRGHRYRIVNPVRFFIFILAVVMMIAFASATLIKSGNAEASSVDTYMQVVVEDRDSLWSIAESYCNTNMDLRDYIDDVCEINDIDSNDMLHEGDVLFVPLY